VIAGAGFADDTERFARPNDNGDVGERTAVEVPEANGNAVPFQKRGADRRGVSRVVSGSPFLHRNEGTIQTGPLENKDSFSF
jgi:hypothetical protein